METWMQEEVASLVAKHGDVPPPWVAYNEHPYSICWRMGGGETHIMVWWEWWAEQSFDEEEKIAYFRKWPPPPCWLPFLIEAVWGVDVLEEGPEADASFERASALGFGSREEYEKDLNDPRWLE